MKIVCAETVLLGHEAFRSSGETLVIPDREIAREHLLDVDALVVRSKTKVTGDLLSGTPVQFVGTATAGTDHMDLACLEAEGRYWCAAPGCNANSVSEYLVAALLALGGRHAFELAGKTMGVVGCGHVGSRVVNKAEALGMTVLRNDPPLASVSAAPDYLPLESLLAESDIISLHVPHVNHGPWPTVHLADSLFFEQLRPGAVFINTARGSVCDYDALLDAKRGGTVSHMIVDVWSPEPAFRIDVLEVTDLASPHIAGHSFEGKLNGTLACYQELCDFFGLPRSWDVAASLPAPPCRSIELDVQGMGDETALHEIVRQVYDIETDDALIRRAAARSEIDRSRKFDALRKDYRTRREFSNSSLQLKNARESLSHKARALGFECPGEGGVTHLCEVR